MPFKTCDCGQRVGVAARICKSCGHTFYAKVFRGGKKHLQEQALLASAGLNSTPSQRPQHSVNNYNTHTNQTSYPSTLSRVQIQVHHIENLPGPPHPNGLPNSAFEKEFEEEMNLLITEHKLSETKAKEIVQRMRQRAHRCINQTVLHILSSLHTIPSFLPNQRAHTPYNLNFKQQLPSIHKTFAKLSKSNPPNHHQQQRQPHQQVSMSSSSSSSNTTNTSSSHAQNKRARHTQESLNNLRSSSTSNRRRVKRNRVSIGSTDGPWICTACTFRNVNNVFSCEVCGVIKSRYTNTYEDVEEAEQDQQHEEQQEIETVSESSTLVDSDATTADPHVHADSASSS